MDLGATGLWLTYLEKSAGCLSMTATGNNFFPVKVQGSVLLCYSPQPDRFQHSGAGQLPAPLCRGRHCLGRPRLALQPGTPAHPCRGVQKCRGSCVFHAGAQDARKCPFASGGEILTFTLRFWHSLTCPHAFLPSLLPHDSTLDL